MLNDTVLSLIAQAAVLGLLSGFLVTWLVLSWLDARALRRARAEIPRVPVALSAVAKRTDRRHGDDGPQQHRRGTWRAE